MLLFISSLYPLQNSAVLLSCVDRSDSYCIEMNKYCNVEHFEYKIFLTFD